MIKAFLLESNYYFHLAFFLLELVLFVVELYMMISAILAWYGVSEELNLHVSEVELVSNWIEEVCWLQMCNMHQYSEKAGVSCELLGLAASSLMVGMLSSLVPYSYELNLSWEFFSPVIVGVYSGLVISRLGWGVFVKSMKSRRYRFIAFVSFPLFSIGVAVRPLTYVFRFGLNMTVGNFMLSFVAGWYVYLCFMGDLLTLEKCSWILIGLGLTMFELLMLAVQVAVIVMLGSVYFSGTPVKWSLGKKW